PEDGFITSLNNAMSSFSIENVRAFGMGRLFRQTHEILLVGVRGKIYKYLENKSQRSVHFFPATKHSVKRENLHRMLEKMFTNSNKLDLFARRKVQGWLCLGNEIEETLGEDIRDSLIRLINENSTS